MKDTYIACIAWSEPHAVESDKEACCSCGTEIAVSHHARQDYPEDAHLICVDCLVDKLEDVRA